jgi:hypothetical protein
MVGQCLQLLQTKRRILFPGEEGGSRYYYILGELLGAK